MKKFTKNILLCVIFISIFLLSGCSFTKHKSTGNFNITKAEELFKDKKYDEALKYVNDFLKIYPNNESAISEKAYILISTGKEEEGLALLTDLYEKGVKNSAILNNMSWAYNKLHMYTMANKYIDICLKSNFNITDKEYINKGNALEGLKKYDEAIVYYDKAYEKNPKSATALWGKGLSLYEKKAYKECLTCFENYEKLDGQNKNLNYYIENSYIKLKDFDGGINKFNKQIEKNTDNISAYTSLARLYTQKGDFEKAIGCYDFVIKKSTEDAEVYYEKSICLAKLGKNDEACDNLKLTLKYDSEYVYDILEEPAFDSLKNNNKFKDLIFNLQDNYKTSDKEF